MKENTDDKKLITERSKVLGSLMLFNQVFFKLRTGRQFIIARPIARESHHIAIARELMRVFRCETDLLVITIPPRYTKTEFLIGFVAFVLGWYPDCNFLYTSYSHNLAARQTETIRNIIQLREYRDLFKVELKQSTKAKFDFETTAGGSVYASGFGGTILGRGAGLKGSDRFGGAIIIDDAHKPIEAHSDTIRQGVIDWYSNTLKSRRNDGFKTPIILIGQRVHEDDLAAHLIKECEEDKTGRKVVLSIPALDEAGNALWPGMHTKDQLLEMQESDPYTFAAQMQQNPQPAGGGVFKKTWFTVLNDEPKIIATFITCDTAETEKNYNDATVFSFWGLYKIKHGEFETDTYGLHWIDCVEIRVEPKDLRDEFMQFYYSCMRYKVKPHLAIIEKKSTGVTLSSALQDIQGLEVIRLDRTLLSGSKTTRFLEIQRFIATKRVTFPYGGKHNEICIEHCSKITANNTHRHDDIADTLVDAVRAALIDQSVINKYINRSDEKANKIISALNSVNQQRQNSRRDTAW